MIIRSSHQTDTVIKSEDIKKILSDDFTPIHSGLKKIYIKLFNPSANKFLERFTLVLPLNWDYRVTGL